MGDCDKVTFQLINTKQSNGEIMSQSNPSSFINLEDSEEIDYIQDGESVVIKKHFITIVVEYPLKSKFIFSLRASKKEGFTRKDLAIQISWLYKWIYRLEAKTTSIPVLPHPTFKYNRGMTDGYFGIWGHYLGGLGLHSIAYDKNKDVYVLGVDSLTIPESLKP